MFHFPCGTNVQIIITRKDRAANVNLTGLWTRLGLDTLKACMKYMNVPRGTVSKQRKTRFNMNFDISRKLRFLEKSKLISSERNNFINTTLASLLLLDVFEREQTMLWQVQLCLLYFWLKWMKYILRRLRSILNQSSDDVTNSKILEKGKPHARPWSSSFNSNPRNWRSALLTNKYCRDYSWTFN